MVEFNYFMNINEVIELKLQHIEFILKFYFFMFCKLLMRLYAYHPFMTG